jgi:hypothetical protein
MVRLPPALRAVECISPFFLPDSASGMPNRTPPPPLPPPLPKKILGIAKARAGSERGAFSISAVFPPASFPPSGYPPRGNAVRTPSLHFNISGFNDIVSNSASCAQLNRENITLTRSLINIPQTDPAGRLQSDYVSATSCNVDNCNVNLRALLRFAIPLSASRCGDRGISCDDNYEVNVCTGMAISLPLSPFFYLHLTRSETFFDYHRPRCTFEINYRNWNATFPRDVTS